MGLEAGMNALLLGIHGQNLSMNGLGVAHECTIFEQ
jgi:hypothetical protein